MLVVVKCSDILFISVFMVVRVLFLEQLKADPRSAGSYMNRIKGKLSQSPGQSVIGRFDPVPRKVCIKLI